MEPEPRRITRQSSKKDADLLVPTTKRKHEKTEKTSNVKSPRKRRSKSNGKQTEETKEDGKGFANQGSWSSGWSLSDDEELPPAVFSSPAKDASSGQVKTYQKHDIVWVKYRRDPYYRPCLITSVHKNYVNFKYVYGNRKSKYRAGLKKLIGFDDPDKNTELLNAGRKIPHIVDAFERARLYFCRLSLNEDLSPLKYLFFDKTEDLLYGIVPEHGSKEDNEEENEDDVFDGPASDSSDMEEDEKDEDSEKDEDGEDKDNCKNTDNPKKDNVIQFVDIFQKMTVEEKANLLENLKIVLKIIDSEECFLHLKQIVESAQSKRMVLLKEERNLDLQMKSGSLGPFLGAESTETDQLMELVEKHADRLQFQGDTALLSLHVLIPEAVIYALQKEWQYTPEEADDFFMEWTNRAPDWRQRKTPCQSA